MNQVLKDRFITKLADGDYYGLALVLSNVNRNVNECFIKPTGRSCASIGAVLGSLVGFPAGEIDNLNSRTCRSEITPFNPVGILKGFSIKQVDNDIHVYVRITPSDALRLDHEYGKAHMFGAVCGLIGTENKDHFIFDKIVQINAMEIKTYRALTEGPFTKEEYENLPQL